MAGTILTNIVRFTGLPIGVPTSLPHGLNVNGTPVVPQLVQAKIGGFLTTASATHITVTRHAGAAPDVDIYVDFRHTITDVTPNLGGLQPFIASQFAGGVASATPTLTFVFRPGGVALDNVYTDWADLMAGVDSVDGLRRILFDDSIVTPCVVPAGTWDMRNVVLMGLLFRPSFVQVNEGVIFLELHQFDANVVLTFVGATPPMSDFSNNDVVILERGSVLRSMGTGPFISMANLAPGEGCIFILRDGARWETGAAPLLEVQAGGNAVVGVLGAFSEFQSNVVSGGAGGALQVLVTANTPLGVSSVDQPAFTGTILLAGNTSRYNFANVLTGDGGAPVGTVTRCDPSGAGFNVFLPPAFNTQGEIILVKNITASANPITVVANGADLIDGAVSAAIAAGFGGVGVVSDGISNWYRFT